MLLWTAVILGIVEGLTEFIPVSSTGHLILAGQLLHFRGPTAKTFDVVIQLGAILAVVWLYRERFRSLLPLAGRKKSTHGSRGLKGLRGCLLLGLTTAPALLIGKFAYGAIKAHLFNATSVAIALAVGAVGILWAERRNQDQGIVSLDNITWGQALAIGLIQCLSMWPGISRAGATIVGGMLAGLRRQTAAEYSFLAAVPVMIAASGYDFWKTRALFTASDLLFLGVGFVVAFGVAYLTVAAFIRLLGRWTLKPFAWYRLALAPIVLLFWPGG
jgi:undecaprenyl-diphosphatase